MKNYFLFDELNNSSQEIDDDSEMISNRSFKALIAFIDDTEDIREVLNSFPAFVFFMDEGRGFTFCVKTFAEAVKKAVRDRYVVYSEYTLTEADEVNNIPGTIAEISESLSPNRLQIAAVNISGFLPGKIYSKYLRDFLKFVCEIRPQNRAAQKNRGEAIFILRCQNRDEDAAKETLDYLDKFTHVRGLRFPPLTESQCFKFVSELIAGYGERLHFETEFALIQKIKEVQKNGKFCGFHTLMKIADNIRYSELKRDVEEMFVENSAEEICPALPKKDDEEAFDRLIGLENIKAQIEEITSAESYKREMGIKTPRPTLHMIFTGSPGTGKSSVARLTAGIFHKNGLLPSNKLIEVTRKDLVGEYIGQTALKTIDVCKMAMGGVLFIDEAYELAQDVENRRDFGPEAISTLIAEMENNRDRFVVIMAGYGEDMERLFKINMGLKDRFAYKLEFENYTREQLCEIFEYLLNEKGHYLESRAKIAAASFFDSLPESLLKSRDFANARFARNLAERTVTKAALRFKKALDAGNLDGMDLDACTAEDFDAASKDKDLKLLQKTAKNQIGYIGGHLREKR